MIVTAQRILHRAPIKKLKRGKAQMIKALKESVKLYEHQVKKH